MHAFFGYMQLVYFRFFQDKDLIMHPKQIQNVSHIYSQQRICPISAKHETRDTIIIDACSKLMACFDDDLAISLMRKFMQHN